MENSSVKCAEVINKMRKLCNQTTSKFDRCTGISQSRLDILMHLYKSDEISQVMLQKEMSIDNSAITRHLKQLEVEGFVSRRKSQEDNRITLVRLTSEGHEKLQAYVDEKTRFVERVLKDFTEEELDVMLKMLERIEQNYKQIQ